MFEIMTVVMTLGVSTFCEDSANILLPEETAFVSKVDRNMVGNVLKPKFSCNCYESTFEFGVDSDFECRCFGKDLREIPDNLNENVTKLSILDSEMKHLEKLGFNPYKSTLKDIILGNLPMLRVIEDRTFADIPNLRTLYISHAPQLKFLHGILEGVTSTKFYSLRITQTGLCEIPELSHLPTENILHLLDLDWNKIERLPTNSVRIRAEQVTINFNELTLVGNSAFNGSQIGRLNLRGNRRLTKLEPHAFKGLQSLRELDLSATSINNLPAEGLAELELLRIEETPSLKTIPSIYDMENLKLAKLTHPFHCCAFKYPEQHDPQRHAQYEEKIKKGCDKSIIDTGQKTRQKRWGFEAFSSEEDDGLGYESIETLPRPPTIEFTPNIEHNKGHPHKGDHSHLDPLVGKTIEHEAAKSMEELGEKDMGTFHEETAVIAKESVQIFCGNLSKRTFLVKCYPDPNALNPCEDIMGFAWLRIVVWFVVVLAVVGNLAVMVVLLLANSELSVSRFLICNLAFADFCMGVYLLLIASMDLHSVGSYFNSAYDWQYGVGCQLAGFLTVFGSHLSIFTLAVITLERWFAITYAIHLTKRIRMSAAAKIMIGGWLYSIIISALPLFGINNYSSTSICLPMEVNNPIERAYLFIIILINGVAFGLIVFCYVQIYISLDKETRSASAAIGEMTIAKKMALLIFTDFVTWAPISFFSITALVGYPLIGVTKSKILLVFFYPINSCANPYLYAIMTAQYRKDFFELVARCGLCKKRAHRYSITNSINHPLNSIGKTGQTEILLRDNNHKITDTSYV